MLLETISELVSVYPIMGGKDDRREPLMEPHYDMLCGEWSMLHRGEAESKMMPHRLDCPKQC